MLRNKNVKEFSKGTERNTARNKGYTTMRCCAHQNFFCIFKVRFSIGHVVQSKIWHAHPVWLLAGNPIVGYSKQKAGWRLMFWSGAGFDKEKLNVIGKKFKDASVFYNTVEQINIKDLKGWLKNQEKFSGTIKT